MFVAGSRAIVPAASVTPLASSPAASVVAPSVSPAPLTPAPTFAIDWSISRPIAPKVSCGVGSVGTTRCGGSGGVTLSGGAESCALAEPAQASNATTMRARYMPAIIFSSNGKGEFLRAGRGQNKELQYAVN